MTPLPWFRQYCREIDDPRIRLLAFEDRWHYQALKMLKGQGHMDAHDDLALFQRMVAVRLGVQVRELDEIARRLSEVKLIDRETLQPLDWNVEQFVPCRDVTAADRKRRQRARERERTRGHLKVVTDASRVTVTDVTCIDSDVDTESDSEKTTTGGASVLDWSFLGGLDAVVVVERLDEFKLTPEQQQAVLDELAGALRKGAIKSSWPGWLRTTAENAMLGDFKLNHGLEIQAARKRRNEEAEAARHREQARIEAGVRRSDPAAQEAAQQAMAQLRATLGIGDD